MEEALERLVIGDGDKLTANNREQGRPGYTMDSCTHY